MKLIIESNDKYKVTLPNQYVLVGYKKENKIVNTFKNTILGEDIGINGKGFSTIILLSTIIAISSLLTLYLIFRV